jgi:diguanylate cyclase (GGDEF)-like protein/putative nucleotidyltransferase with HDIG domain
VLVLGGAASIVDTAGVNYVAYSLLALTAFGLTLSDGSDMGFVFVILALRQLSWNEAMLMGGASLFIQSAVRRQRPAPQALLRSLASTGLAVLLSQAVFHLPQLRNADEAARFMIASVACFVGYNFRGLNRMNFWPFPYYPVAAAIAALFPASIMLVPAVFLTWRSYRLYARRLEKQCAETQKISDLYMRTVETLAIAIEAKDQPMSGRSRRVQVYATEIARQMLLADAEVQALRTAALLYDIGELAVPEHIMLKPSGLTTEEFEKVKIHPTVGAEILERVRFPHPVAPIVRAHHERWDGKGYPNGLAGTAIPIGARILSAVDALDAMASPRLHRPAQPVDVAVKHLESQSGLAFDPEVVNLIVRGYQRWEQLVAHDTDGFFIDSIFEAQREVQILQHLTSSLSSSLDTGSTFDALRKALRQLIPFQSMIVWLQKGAEALEPAFMDGDHPSHWTVARIPLGEGISGAAAMSGAPQNGLNPSIEIVHLGGARANHSIRHVLAIPLDLGEIRGSITIYRVGDLSFSPEDVRLLSSIAPKVASALTNSRRFDQINQVDLSDALTGLPNAKALAIRMQTLEAPTTVVVCDLDGFKSVNDRFGHLTGNRLLESIAKTFQSGCRGNDFVARTGGDEFVLILPGLRRHETGPRLEQFREMVRISGRIVCGEDVIDASFGAAFYPADQKDPEELLSHADSQMYRRKAEQKTGVLPIRPPRSGAA